MPKPKRRYEIQITRDFAVKTSTAVELPKGWLDYSLRDGTVGLARPGSWKELTNAKT